jgi:hypothetical protein
MHRTTLAAVLALAWGSALPGCGDSSGPVDVVADADAALSDVTDAESGADADAAADADASPDVREDEGTAEAVDGTDAEAGTETDGGEWIVPPLTACGAVADPCTSLPTVSGIHAAYRKDFFFPNSWYDEPTTPPLDGGRIQIAAVSAVTGDVTTVRVDGTDADALLHEPTGGELTLEWYHVWPRHVVAGEPVWVAFHSRTATWDTATSGTIEVQTTEGAAVSGSFAVTATQVPLTYVTTADDYSTLLVHAKNVDAVPHTLTGLAINGREVLAAGAACVPATTLEPGATALWTIPLCAPTAPGAAWTVVATWADTADSVGVGRVIREFFPFESWPNTDECPFPTVHDTNFRRHQDAGLDTTFMYIGGGGACGGFDPRHIVNDVAPVTPGFHPFIADDFLSSGDPATALTNTSAVAGFLIGDESDGAIYDAGVPVPSQKAAEARRLWDMYPELPVYNGAKTNKYVGSFAGMCDIQGIDFYVAACAPHITRWGTHPPLRGAYDYLRNARNNHMPLPTWEYAQGLAPGWNKDGLLGGTIHVQPDPQEILVQALSVAAAGAKGIMWFQVNLAEADYRPARWEAIARSNWMLRGVAPYLREGDPTGLATWDDATPDDPRDDTVLAEAIRSREAIVVPVVNLAVATAPTDLGCGTALVAEALVPHWILAASAPNVGVRVPDDFGVVDAFEITDREVLDLDFSLAVSGRVVTLESVALSNEVPVRLIVLAADRGLRGAIAARLRP